MVMAKAVAMVAAKAVAVVVVAAENAVAVAAAKANAVVPVVAVAKTVALAVVAAEVAKANALFDQIGEIYQEHAKQANVFWVENYDPEFTCQHERKVRPLGDGGKWVCDPHRIDKDNYIVYSVGSCGDFTFEEAVLKDVSKSCEIHTFDVLAERNGEAFAELAKKAGVEFHHYGLGSPGRGNPNCKRFKDIIPELKHEGKQSI